MLRTVVAPSVRSIVHLGKAAISVSVYLTSALDLIMYTAPGSMPLSISFRKIVLVAMNVDEPVAHAAKDGKLPQVIAALKWEIVTLV